MDLVKKRRNGVRIYEKLLKECNNSIWRIDLFIQGDILYAKLHCPLNTTGFIFWLLI